MPRRRNENTIESVRLAAWKLLMHKGYAAVTYADVAREAHVAKSMVQHYFPRKEQLAAACLESLLEGATAAVAEHHPDAKGPVASLYLIGQTYIASFFSGEGPSRFFLDVLTDRALTHETIARDFRWTVAYTLGEGRSDEGMAPPDDIAVSMGGLYELLYVCLRQGRVPDIARRIQPPLRDFAGLYGIPMKDIEDAFATHALSTGQVTKLGRTAVANAARSLDERRRSTQPA